MRVAICGDGPLAQKAEDLFLTLGASVQRFERQDVLSLHKAHLAPGESIVGHTRFFDLFVVSFLVEVEWESKRSTMENFDYFDIVIEISTPLPFAMGSSGSWAINEKQLKEKGARLIYGNKAHQFVPEESDSNIIVVGRGERSYQLLDQWMPWWKQDKSRILHFVSTDLFDVEESILKQKKEQREVEILCFEQEMAEYRSLEEYERVKWPCPIEPCERLFFWRGYSVLTVDLLEDREGLFLSIERPEFKGESHLKVLHGDVILVDRGDTCEHSLTESAFGPTLEKEELGYLFLTGLDQYLDKEEKSIETFVDHISQYFTPCGSEQLCESAPEETVY